MLTRADFLNIPTIFKKKDAQIMAIKIKLYGYVNYWNLSLFRLLVLCFITPNALN